MLNHCTKGENELISRPSSLPGPLRKKINLNLHNEPLLFEAIETPSRYTYSNKGVKQQYELERWTSQKHYPKQIKNQLKSDQTRSDRIKSDQISSGTQVPCPPEQAPSRTASHTRWTRSSSRRPYS